MDFELEETYIGTKKNHFQSLFKKDAEEHTDEFLQYLSEQTNRRLASALEDLSKDIKSLKDKIEERE